MASIGEPGARVFIVPTTHWDRAWYCTFEVFRRRLVQLFDRLIDLLERDPDYGCFVADGQTVVIEDYLAIRPDRRARLETLIRAGRIRIGPWYVLPDEFIVSGESLVRNLQAGARMAWEMGGAMPVGYVPDPFGHAGQRPQVLRGFGIDSFIFTRGIHQRDDQPIHFWWEAPDGSRVLAVHQHDGYCNGANLGYPSWGGEHEYMRFDMERALTTLQELVERMQKRSAVPDYLVNNGVDHVEAQPQTAAIVQAARRRWPEARIRLAGFDDYIRAVRQRLRRKGIQLPVLKHELTYPHGNLLKGVYSARMYLKQANQRAELKLGYLAEPLEALAERLHPARTDERDLLAYAWRELLKNHPHDDICGCSIDRVHRDMMNRFERVEELADAVTEGALEDVAARLDHSHRPGIPFVVYHPAPTPRNEAVRLRLQFFEEEHAYRDGRFTLRNERGRTLPFEIAGTAPQSVLRVRKYERMHAVDVIVHPGRLPPMGLRTLYVAAAATGPAELPARVRCTDHTLENEFLRVRVAANGAYTLTDRRTGLRFPGLGVYEDTEDCGDEYNWSDLPDSRPILSRGGRAQCRVHERFPLSATLRIEQTMSLPEGLRADGEARSRRTRRLRLVTDLTLRAGADRLEVRTTVDNPCRDHRLRVLFPTPFACDAVQAGGHFDTVERVCNPRRHLQFDAGKRDVYPTEHFAGFVHAGDRNAGLTLLARGLCEYEAVAGRGGVTLALTLMRCVGMLSGRDLRRRSDCAAAGPEVPAPEAQMQGRYAFDYALRPCRGRWTSQGLAGQHLLHALEPLVARGDENGALHQRDPSATERFMPVRREGSMPDTFPLVELAPRQLVLTCLRRADEGSDWILRFCNPTPHRLTARLRLAFAVRGIWSSDLREVRGRRIQGPGPHDEVRLPVHGKRIVTLRVRPAS